MYSGNGNQTFFNLFLGDGVGGGGGGGGMWGVGVRL